MGQLRDAGLGLVGLLLQEADLRAELIILPTQQGLFLQSLALIGLNGLDLLFQLRLGVPGLLKLVGQAAGIGGNGLGHAQKGCCHAGGAQKG